jgi:hypothetical protein
VEWCSFIKHFSNIVYPPIPFLKPWKRNVQSNSDSENLIDSTAMTR